MNDMTTRTPRPATPAMPAHGDRSGRPGTLRNWRRWAPYAAPLWALVYGIVALGWTLTGSGFPIDADDPADETALLGNVPADVGAPLFAAVALAAAATGAVMARVREPATTVPRWWRRLALAFGSAVAAVLLVVVPDTRVLALVGYLPWIVAKAPFDAEVRATVGEAVAGQLHELIALAGGFLWAAAVLIYARRTVGACLRCGRNGQEQRWTAAAVRWGVPATYVAAVIPALYSATRWIWVAGVPLGLDENVHAEGMADGSLWSGAWLGSFALVGTVLTLGLVRPWGEVFPRWMPFVRGRRVPVMLAVAPALFVAVIATSGGLGLINAGFVHGAFGMDSDSWGAVGPALLWPLWGMALAVAAVAYHHRRRGTCGDCGRG